MKMWLDDVRHPAAHGCVGWTWVKTAPEAVALLAEHDVDEMSLDHDLGMCDDCAGAASEEKIAAVRGAVSYCACPHNGTGYDVVCWMEEHERWPPQRPRVHSMNPVGAERMRRVIAKAYDRG